jgi:hypothetical protein
MTANVALTDTFDQWRVKSNELVVMSQAVGMSNFIKTTDTSNSTNTSTGSIITSGGIGVAKSIYVGGDLTVDGDTTISGNLVFGDAETDQVTFTADINSNIIPNANLSFNLGNTTMLWANTFTGHLTVTQKTDSAKAAVTITSADVDQIALDINASQQTANVIDITATAATSGHGINISAGGLTTGSALYIDSDSSDAAAVRSVAKIINNNAAAVGAIPLTLQQDSTNAAMFIDYNNASTAAHTGRGLYIDYDKTGIIGNSTTASILGIDIDIDDTATNHSGSTTTYYGVKSDIVAEATGAATTYGIYSNVGSGDNNYSGIFTGGLFGIGVAAPTAWLEVEQGASGGQILFKLDNDDTDKVAMSIEAANIDANVIDITADAVTSAKVINVTADGLTGTACAMLYLDSNSGDTSSRTLASIINNNAAAVAAQVLKLQQDSANNNLWIETNDASVATHTSKGIFVDYNKSGVTGSGATATVYGIDIDLDDAATNHASGVVNQYGLNINSTVANAQGTINNYGIYSVVAGGDNNYPAIFTGGNVGIGTATPGAQLDIQGAAGSGTATAGVLRLSTAELTVVDSDQLGRIEFLAPLETGTDAIKVAASIYAEADNTFATDNNETELVFATGASETAIERLRITSSGQISTGAEAAPDVDAGGICIQQGAADTIAFSIKNSDVSHAALVAGLGATPETDTYFHIEKLVDASGGALITGATDIVPGTINPVASTTAAPQALTLQGLSAGGNTTQTTSGAAQVEIHGYVANTGGVQSAPAGTNILAVRTKNSAGSTVSLLILDEDGDLLVDGAYDEATFDSFDDAAMVRSLSTFAATPGAIIKGKWDEFVQYGKQELMDAGILGKITPKEEAEGHRPMLNTTQLSRLHNGAIWQQQVELNNMKAAMFDLMVDVAGETLAREKLDAHGIKLPGVNDKLNLIN